MTNHTVCPINTQGWLLIHNASVYLMDALRHARTGVAYRVIGRKAHYGGKCINLLKGNALHSNQHFVPKDPSARWDGQRCN